MEGCGNVTWREHRNIIAAGLSVGVVGYILMRLLEFLARCL